MADELRRLSVPSEAAEKMADVGLTVDFFREMLDRDESSGAEEACLAEVDGLFPGREHIKTRIAVKVAIQQLKKGTSANEQQPPLADGGTSNGVFGSSSYPTGHSFLKQWLPAGNRQATHPFPAGPFMGMPLGTSAGPAGVHECCICCGVCGRRLGSPSSSLLSPGGGREGSFGGSDAKRSKMSKFVCGICQWQFSELTEISDHVKLSHPDQKEQPGMTPPYVCVKCHKGFDAEDALGSHFEALHTRKQKVKKPARKYKLRCGICSHTCGHTNKLMKHMDTAGHPIEEVKERAAYACGECTDVSFPAVEGLKMHIAVTHSAKEGDKQLSANVTACGICHVKFTGVGSLVQHLDETHTAYIRGSDGAVELGRCIPCDRGFHSVGDIWEHKMVDHPPQVDMEASEAAVKEDPDSPNNLQP